MKTNALDTFLRRLSCIALLGLALAPSVIAGPIEGSISFEGRVTLNTTSVTTANRVTSWVNPTVGSVDGDFDTFINPGAVVTFKAPWHFNTNTTVVNFWQVGGFHFDLLSSSIIYQGFGTVAVEGTGMMYGHGFTPTAGSWSFTTQNPSAKSRFSFSAAAAALNVPEGGTTLSLFGSALILGALFRRGSR